MTTFCSNCTFSRACTAAAAGAASALQQRGVGRQAYPTREAWWWQPWASEHQRSTHCSRSFEALRLAQSSSTMGWAHQHVAWTPPNDAPTSSRPSSRCTVAKRWPASKRWPAGTPCAAGRRPAGLGCSPWFATVGSTTSRPIQPHCSRMGCLQLGVQLPDNVAPAAPLHQLVL